LLRACDEPSQLDLVLGNYKKLKKEEVLQEYSRVFKTTIGLLCAYTYKKQQA
jgi:hypothetical protein